MVSTITRFVLGRHILSDLDEELQEPLRSTYNKGIALLGVRGWCGVVSVWFGVGKAELSEKRKVLEENSKLSSF